jgi:hypothetical protein
MTALIAVWGTCAGRARHRDGANAARPLAGGRPHGISWAAVTRVVRSDFPRRANTVRLTAD